MKVSSFASVVLTILPSIVDAVEGGNLGQTDRILDSTNPFMSSTSNTTNSSDTTSATEAPVVDDTDETADDEEPVFLTGLAAYGLNTTISPLLNWPESKCIDNLTWVFEDVFLKGEFEPRKYHICPGTYEIGYREDGGCCAENKHPSFVIRSYAEYICGEDGKSSNNCIISGGDVQLMATQHEFTGEPSKGIAFRGFTFEKAELFQILIANEGDYIFDDCIFKDHGGLGTIVMAYDPTPFVSNRRLEGLVEVGDSRFEKYNRLMKSLERPGQVDREMVTSATDDLALTRRCMVVFNNSMFMNNTLGGDSRYSQPGIILAERTFHDIIIQNTMFTKNNFYFPDDVTEGYAMRLQRENTVRIENSCFIDNQFFGDGVVIFNDTVVEGMTNNFVSSTLENDLSCAFAYQEGDETCTPPDATTCALLEQTPLTPQTDDSSNTGKDETGKTDGSNSTGTSSAAYSLYSYLSVFIILVGSTISVM